MPRRIDTAFIEFVPDFSAVVQAEREIERTFAGVTKAAEKSAESAETSFDELGHEIAATFEEIARTGTVDMDRLVTVADRVALEMGSDFQRAGEVSERAFTELRLHADRQLDAVATRASVVAAGTSKKFSAMGLIGGAAIGGIALAATAGLGVLATMGLSSAASLEQTQISFNALLGSVEEGTRVFKELQKFAAVTPFEFPDLAEAAKRFFAFNQTVGMSDAQLEGFLTTVGDLASVTGAGAEGLNRIVLAMGQIASKGKTSLEELMQIGEAVPGFSAIGAIAEHLGVTTGEAMDMISAGAVDAKTGIDALLEGMEKFPGAAGAMEKQSQTLLGVFSTFKDTVGQALADAFTPAIPAIKDALTQLTPIIGEALKSLAPALGGVIVGIMNLLGPIIKGVAGLLSPILAALGPALSQLGPVFEQMAGPLGEVGVALTPIIPLLGNFVLAVLELAMPLLQLLVPALQLLTPVLQLAADAVGEFARWLGTVHFGEVAKDIGGGFADAWDSVVNFFVGIGEFFSELPGQIAEFIAELPGVLVDAIKTTFKAALFAIGVGIGLIVAWFILLPKLIFFAIAQLPQIVFNKVVEMRDLAILTLVNFVRNAVETVKELLPKIAAELLELRDKVGEFFVNMWEKAKETTFNAIVSIVAWVQDLPNKIANLAHSIGESIVSFFKTALNAAIDKINEGIGWIDDKLPMVDLPRIPRLARGAIIDTPTIAQVGEAGPEVVVPLTDPARAQQLANQSGLTQMITAQQTSSAPTVNVTVLIGQRELDDIIDVRVSKAMNRLGQNLAFGSRSA